jgi:hypothetical protein
VNYKRRKPKNARAGCLWCKRWKANRAQSKPENVPLQERKAKIDEKEQRREMEGREMKDKREFKLPSEKDRDERKEVAALFARLKERLSALQKLLEECDGHWGGEEGVYRFYHQSWKVYDLQDLTRDIVNALRELASDRPLNRWFEEIVAQGTGNEFEPKHNDQWTAVTRPIVEAFFHARYFLQMAVKYGRELEFPPALMPSGWAAILYLFDLR